MTTAFSTYNTDGDRGLWLCVDLSYPDHLHERHNEFPLAPESRKVGWHELSPRQQQLFAMQWAKSRDDPTLAKKFHAMSASKRAEMLTLIQSRNVNPDGDDRSRDYVPPSDELPVKWDQLSKRQQLLLSLQTTLDKTGHRIHWQGYSDVLVETAGYLGLTQALHLSNTEH